MSGRAGLAAGILLLWMVGLGLLARRELFRPEAEKLAEAAMLVSPTTEYYVVSQRGGQIGFATSAIDTTPEGIDVRDVVVADLSADGVLHRATARLLVQLTRSLKLRGFALRLGGAIGPLTAKGDVSGDSLLTVIVTAEGAAPDTQRVPLTRPLLLPTVVPLAIALAHDPAPGKQYTFAVYDPMALATTELTVHVRAESTFVVTDSAAFDRRGKRWVAARSDTVKAWRIEAEDGGMFPAGWIDQRGRVIEATQFGTFTVRRTAYEIAYENWSIERTKGAIASIANGDIQEATAIEANARIQRKSRIARLRLLLGNVRLEGFDLAGGRQRRSGDTLEIRRESGPELRAAYTLPANLERFDAALKAEPFIQSDHPEMRRLSATIVGSETEPGAAAMRINRWLFKTLDKKVTFALPNALQVLRSRSGDCNEHTALFIALARAAGIPARSASGLAYVGGKFYYHAWPEVYLNDWVAVDPTFGQFPADAAHVRFVTGGFARQAELIRLVGALRVDVISTQTIGP